VSVELTKSFFVIIAWHFVFIINLLIDNMTFIHMYAVQSEVGKKIIRYKGTKLWNELPDNIKRITSPLFSICCSY